MKRKEIIASLAVGIFSVVLFSAYLIWGFINLPSTEWSSFFVYGFLPMAIPSFIVCSLLSLWYLSVMRGKNWLWGLLLGPIFGAMAGGISGFIFGIKTSVVDWGYEPLNLFDIFFAFGGLIVGSITGLIISLVAGPFYFKAGYSISWFRPLLSGTFEYFVHLPARSRWSIILLILLAAAIIGVMIYLVGQLGD